MRVPDSLVALLNEGVIDDVIRPLKSGKEAQVYLVVSNGEVCVAKVYKDADNRSFKNRADYTEGRNVRSSRDQRAMASGSKFGRAQNEATWKSTEVDMIYKLDAAGVRVPRPYHFIEGVLLMELVKDEHGDPAPRLGDIEFSKEVAEIVYGRLLREVVRMLAAGIVHGDLSDFNVLMDPEGPVVIDFPQAVYAARNQSARKLLIRDVDNLHRFVSRFSPGHKALPYAQEMWQLYERGELHSESELTGRFVGDTKVVNTRALLNIVKDAHEDERARRIRLGLPLQGMRDERGSGRGRPQGRPQPAARPSQPPPRDPHHSRPQHNQPQHPRPQQPQRSEQRPPQGAQPNVRPQQPQAPRPHAPNGNQGPNANPNPNPNKRRRRRRRRGGGGGGPAPSTPPPSQPR
jgi:RIO kinase 1